MEGGDHKLMPLEIVQLAETKVGPNGKAIVLCLDYPGGHNKDESTHKQDVIFLN